MMTTAKRYDLTIDGHRLVAFGYNEDQPGKPLILLHGILASASFWPENAPGVSPGQRWYALTLPGHYPARWAEGFRRETLTAELIADLVAGAIQQLCGGQRVFLAGHSTGGFAALAVAARHPQLVDKVLSISGFAQGKWYGPLRLLQMQARMGPIGEVLFRFNVRLTMLTPRVYTYASGLYASDRGRYFAYPDLRQHVERLYADARQHDLHGMAHYFARMPDIDIRDWLPRIQAPTLALAGSRDGIVPPEQARLIAELVPDARLMLLDGAGHMPMAERPEVYEQTLRDWLG
ncbi:MAG: alpha/beta hydrolase [Anaerolineae bacterium]|nr:alpha/beta hydrolase [Anaerolineae bacterium]